MDTIKRTLAAWRATREKNRPRKEGSGESRSSLGDFSLPIQENILRTQGENTEEHEIQVTQRDRKRNQKKKRAFKRKPGDLETNSEL